MSVSLVTFASFVKVNGFRQRVGSFLKIVVTVRSEKNSWPLGIGLEALIETVLLTNEVESLLLSWPGLELE